MIIENDNSQLFVDDTVVFCEASVDQMIFLRSVFIWFKASFGLRINWDKSELISVGMVKMWMSWVFLCELLMNRCCGRWCRGKIA